MPSAAQRRLLILTSKLGYQTRAFVAAAEKLGLEVCYGTDRCGRLDDPWGDHAVPLHFEDPDEATRRVLKADIGRVDAVISLGDRPTPTAARVAHALGLPHHSAASADVCRDKYRSRELLRNAGLLVPEFVRFGLELSPEEAAARIEQTVGFPCVLKPLALSGSRGVIRANDAAEARAAFERIRALLRSPEVRALREQTSEFVQAESYVPGVEVAVEALVARGDVKILALFDKPDPLDGPFFEETIYVTPSRLPQEAQREVVTTVERAIAALGLTHGPVHAELRLNERGAWPLEVAARCIGGLCARALRFTNSRWPSVNGSPEPCSAGVSPATPSIRVAGETPALHGASSSDAELHSLEEIIIRLAMGEDVSGIAREPAASGVMMIPIPQAGIYRDVEGVDDALRVRGIDEIRITAKPDQKLVPLPEGASYLGFIFARAERPEQVEAALREAHGKLRFHIAEALPVVR